MITVTKFKGVKNEVLITVRGVGEMNLFKTLIQRGVATWADAPPSIKEFADIITTGHALQPYATMSSESQPADTDAQE